MDSSIRNGRCYRDLKRLEKIREDAKTLQHLLKEKFTTNNRVYLGVRTWQDFLCLLAFVLLYGIV